MNTLHHLKTFKRNLVIRLIENGETDSSIATLTELSESWVRHLRHVYRHEGAEGLILKKPGGSVCRLSPENLEHLCTILDKGAVAYGLEGAFWDRKRVKYVIEQEFKVEYDVEHISHILARLNYTLQRPRKKDFRQSDEKVDLWKTETLPEIKKK